MSNTASKLAAIKARVEKAQVARIRAEAARDEAMARIRELGFDSIEDAQTALAEIRDDIAKQETKLANDIAKLERDFPELEEL